MQEAPPAPEPVDDADPVYENGPIVVREKTHASAPMTVAEAVDQMELVGHDFFLFQTVRYGSRPSKTFALAQIAFGGKYTDATILRWFDVFLRRFFSQQFKRSAMPDGPKVGSVALSPRGDWRMPSDATATAWLRELEEAEEP